MASWTKTKDLNAINGGEEFTKGKKLSRSSLNAIINNSLYVQDKIDKLTDKNVNGVLTTGEKGDGGQPPNLFFAGDYGNPNSNISFDYSKSANHYNFSFPKSLGELDTNAGYITSYIYPIRPTTSGDDQSREGYILIQRTIFNFLNNKKIEIWQFDFETELSSNMTITSWPNKFIKTPIAYNNYASIIALSSSSSRVEINTQEAYDGNIMFRIVPVSTRINVQTTTQKTIFNFLVILQN